MKLSYILPSLHTCFYHKCQTNLRAHCRKCVIMYVLCLYKPIYRYLSFFTLHLLQWLQMRRDLWHYCTFPSQLSVELCLQVGENGGIQPSQLRWGADAQERQNCTAGPTALLLTNIHWIWVEAENLRDSRFKTRANKTKTILHGWTTVGINQPFRFSRTWLGDKKRKKNPAKLIQIVLTKQTGTHEWKDFKCLSMCSYCCRQVAEGTCVCIYVCTPVRCRHSAGSVLSLPALPTHISASSKRNTKFMNTTEARRSELCRSTANSSAVNGALKSWCPYLSSVPLFTVSWSILQGHVHEVVFLKPGSFGLFPLLPLLLLDFLFHLISWVHNASQRQREDKAYT